MGCALFQEAEPKAYFCSLARLAHPPSQSLPCRGLMPPKPSGTNNTTYKHFHMLFLLALFSDLNLHTFRDPLRHSLSSHTSCGLQDHLPLGQETGIVISRFMLSTYHLTRQGDCAAELGTLQDRFKLGSFTPLAHFSHWLFQLCLHWQHCS